MKVYESPTLGEIIVFEIDDIQNDNFVFPAISYLKGRRFDLVCLPIEYSHLRKVLCMVDPLLLAHGEYFGGILYYPNEAFLKMILDYEKLSLVRR